MSFRAVLSAQKPVGVFRYTLDTILLGGTRSPWLDLRYAGQGNEAYQSAVLRIANERRGRSGAGKFTATKLREDRELDARVFAETIVVGWGEIYEDGKPAPCTPAKVLELLQVLAEDHEYIFLGITQNARDATNYQDVPTGAGVELGKG